MSAAAAADETKPEPAEKPKAAVKKTSYRIEALATGDAGAIKLMILTSVEPDPSKLENYRSRVSAQYRMEFDAWSNAPTVKVTEQ